MAEAVGFAPDQETIAYGRATLPQRIMSPGVVGTLCGPGNAGPEQAGGLSLVYGSFADPAGAQLGFRAFTDAQRSMLDAPGFLRWINFSDGPHGFGLGWWRTADDAVAWTRGDAHRTFVNQQRAAPFELSQFAGIWSAHLLGQRNYYCPRCHQRAAASAAVCECGEPLADGFGSTPTRCS